MADIVNEIKARIDVLDVVGDRVLLKKAGSTYKGLCPFHAEKTPSFVVFPETGTWKCFGCGEGGDLFGFVMRSQNVDFREALSILAARAGVDLQPTRSPGVEKSDAERLHAINQAAAEHFRSMLEGPAGTRARAYLEAREIKTEGIVDFSIGFAPDGGASLAHHLMQTGFERETVLQAGLAGANESGGLYDRFRNRIVFPIRDASGRIVGFGGRALSSDTHPKYLNTPQTPIFDKGGSLYAIDRAKDEIRRGGQAVIVEGYMDAIMAHQHGFRNVVASLGTAVTERQITLLKRWATELCFALDPDEAGQEATARGLEVAMDTVDTEAIPVATAIPTPAYRGLARGRDTAESDRWTGMIQYVYRLRTTIKIIALPPGRDPDDLIREDPDGWRGRVQAASPVQDFFIERVRHKHDLSSAAGKAAAVEEAMAVIGRIPDPVQQAHYVQRLAALVGIDERILLQQVRHLSRRTPRSRRAHVHAGDGVPGGVEHEAGDPGEAGAGHVGAGSLSPAIGMHAEAYCIALLLKNVSLLESGPRLEERHFADPMFQELYRRLLQYIESGTVDTSASGVADRLRQELDGPLRDRLERVLEMATRHPALFNDPQDKAYKSAVVIILLNDLASRRRQLEAMQSEVRPDSDPEEFSRLVKMHQEMTRESHRIHLLGATVPELRTRYREVRHGE
jgi:DNA primase